MSQDWETPCPKREDKQHCEHWYDGERCCACGDNAPMPEWDDKPMPLHNELTPFQFKSIVDCAASPTGTYLLVVPNMIVDGPEQVAAWTQHNRETDELIALGLLRDASEEHKQQIAEYIRDCGRKFRVLKITPVGKVMFDESSTSASVI